VGAQLFKVPNEVVLGFVLCEATKPALRTPVNVLKVGLWRRNEVNKFGKAQNMRGHISCHFHRVIAVFATKFVLVARDQPLERVSQKDSFRPLGSIHDFLHGSQILFKLNLLEQNKQGYVIQGRLSRPPKQDQTPCNSTHDTLHIFEIAPLYSSSPYGCHL